MQGVVFGSLFYAPFYLLAWVIFGSIPWVSSVQHGK